MEIPTTDITESVFQPTVLLASSHPSRTKEEATSVSDLADPRAIEIPVPNLSVEKSCRNQQRA